LRAYKGLLEFHLIFKDSKNFMGLYKQYLDNKITFSEFNESILKLIRSARKLADRKEDNKIFLTPHSKSIDFWKPHREMVNVCGDFCDENYDGLNFYGLTSSEVPEENFYEYVEIAY
jgi:hypothetical protein